jgi:hypothetical protein
MDADGVKRRLIRRRGVAGLSFHVEGQRKKLTIYVEDQSDVEAVRRELSDGEFKALASEYEVEILPVGRFRAL